MGRRRSDIVGKVYGRLTVVEYIPIGRWRCLCACGNTAVVLTSSIKRRGGGTTSCGCAARDRNVRLSAELTRHGYTKSGTQPLAYESWLGAKKRCLDATSPAYGDYGGRGITMCREWQRDFGAFMRHLGERPSRQHSLERIDNNAGYEPGNVKWATKTEQARNRRSTFWVEIDGERVSLAEAAERSVVSYATLQQRLKAGWDVRRAMNAPAAARRPPKRLDTRALRLLENP